MRNYSEHANSVLRMLAFRQISSSICRSNHMSREQAGLFSKEASKEAFGLFP